MSERCADCRHPIKRHDRGGCAWPRCTCQRLFPVDYYRPTPTRTKDTAMNNLPRVIDVADVEPGDLIELTNGTEPDWLLRDRARLDEHGDLYVGDRQVGRAVAGIVTALRVRLLDRPAPAPLTAEELRQRHERVRDYARVNCGGKLLNPEHVLALLDGAES